MRSKSVMVWVMVIVAAMCIPAVAADVIGGISATAADTTYGDVANTVNGAGMLLDLHDNDYTHMWAKDFGMYTYPGCQTGGPWLAYEFDGIYELDEMWVWNFNEEWAPWDQSTSGLKDVYIQYSTTGGPDASEWTTLGGGTTQFNKAPYPAEGWNVYRWNGELNPNYNPDAYAHNTEVDFGGVQAKYVVITPSASSGWWGNAYYLGLSEVRFHEVPEPVTVLLIGLGGLIVARKLKR